MNFDLYIKSGSQFVNCNDYLIGSEPVPFIDRNRDYELIVSEFSIGISSNAPDFEKNNEVLIVANELDISRCIFTGYIGEKKKNEDSSSWEYLICSDLKFLQTYFLDYETLNNDFVNNSPDINSLCPASFDNEFSPNIRVIYAIERMFSIAGLQINFALVKDDVIFNRFYDGREESILLSKIAIDARAIYAINQSYVAFYREGSNFEPTLDSLLNLFDFIKLFFSLTGIFIIPIGEKSFKVYRRTDGNYSVIDDLKWKYSLNEIEKRTDGYGYEMRFGYKYGEEYRRYYGDLVTGYTPVTQVIVDSGKENIPWYDNLFFLIRRTRPVNVTNIVYDGGGRTSIYVEDITTYSDVVLNRRHIEITGVQGMTEINGIHTIYTFIISTKRIIIFFTPTNSYTSGGIVDHAGTVYPDYYWHLDDPIRYPDEGLGNKKKILLNDYISEEITTQATITPKAVVKNYIDMNSHTSEIVQEIYE